MFKKGLILDFETMSENYADCAVIDMSAIVFDTDKMLSDEPYTCKSIVQVKRFKLSVKEQVKKYEFKISDSTLKFWESQSDDVKAKIKPRSDDLTLEAFTKEFISYLSDNGKIDYWFTRGNVFDGPILYRLFDTQNKVTLLNEYLKFWRIQDTRTYINAKLDFPKVNGFVPIKDEEFWNKVFQAHDSSWDVIADLLRLQTIIRLENDLEQTKR